MFFWLSQLGTPTHFSFLEYVNKIEELGLLAIALGSPQLKGDIDGKVANAHKGSKKDVLKSCGKNKYINTLYERNPWQIDLGTLLFCHILVENLKLVWFRE